MKTDGRSTHRGTLLQFPAGRSALAGLLAAGLAACGPAAADELAGSFYHADGAARGTFYGAAHAIGSGVGRSYITMAGDSVIEVGVALSEAALEGLPAGPGHASGGHEHYNELQLPMHPRNPTPIRFVAVNWNAEGHEPEEIYGLPHFDFHFYTITPEQVAAIDPADANWSVKANRLPPAEQVPAQYVSAHEFLPDASPADATVPRMGLHWMDVRSPELAGQTFTETFIYGSYDGQFIFLEPMVTRAFLLSRAELRRELPRAREGYNAGAYRVYWHAARSEYRVALTDLPAAS